jgi:hypothetical protein
MARPQGIVPLSGKVGDLIFAKRNGKRHVKAKSTKPMNQTAATKKSSSDFGEASKAGARIRYAFVPLIKNYGDGTLVSRFTKHLLKVFKTIPSAFVGHKKLNQGDIGIFKGFQFNAWARLDSLLFDQPVVELEKSGLKIVFEENLVANLFKRTARADAVVLQLMVYSLNLNGGDDEVVSIKDLVIPLDEEHFRGAKLKVPLNYVGEQVVWVALGIHYLGEKKWMIGDKTKRAAAITYVKRLNDGVEVPFVPYEQESSRAEVDEEGLDWELL